MINIAICDDEQNWLDELEKRITLIDREIVISKHNNPFSLMTYIADCAKGTVDAIYMDVHLKNQSGIRVAESILSDFPNIKIVFVSKNTDCMTEIFRINPVYFLLKPYNSDDIRYSIYKITNMINEERMDTITLGSASGKGGRGVIKTSDIYYVESQLRIVHIHTFDAYSAYYARLDEIESMLKENFVRVHQSFIVNMDKIKIIKNKQIELYNGVKIPISKSKYKEKVELINNYLRLE